MPTQPPVLSVVIPSLNEARNDFFRASLSMLAARRDTQTIVSDGGSSDETERIVRDIHPGALLLRGHTNSRSVRLSDGIAASLGKIIILHHPRSVLSAEAFDYAASHAHELVWGGFTHRFDRRGAGYAFTSWYSNKVRARVSNIVYLDHCIYARAELLKSLLPLRDIDIFEDLVISRSLYRASKTRARILPFYATTSAVRFVRNGFWRQAFANQALKAQFWLGCDLRAMNAKYEKNTALNSVYKGDEKPAPTRMAPPCPESNAPPSAPQKNTSKNQAKKTQKHQAKYIDSWSAEHFTRRARAVRAIAEGDEIISSARAGDGNMNIVLRLTTRGGDSLIAKQAPPFCAKFPHIPAPPARLAKERRYYALCEGNKILRAMSPRMRGFDRARRLLYMDDLGATSDFEGLYAGEPLAPEHFDALVAYLRALHTVPVSRGSLSNARMRRLNHDYIFILPFSPPSAGAINLDAITPGLSAVAADISKNARFRKNATRLGQLYLHEKRCLIHGDFYPRSWLLAPQKHEEKNNGYHGLYVIDPEFGFVGMREFDLGVFLAHLTLCGHDGAREQLRRAFSDECARGLLSWDYTLAFMAMEVLRRLLYVSQLPIRADLAFKRSIGEECVEIVERVFV